MNTKEKQSKKMNIILYLLSCIIWPFLYIGTVSYESTYFVITLVAIASIIYLCKKEYRMNVKSSIPYLVLAAVISMLLILSDYSIFLSGGKIGVLKGLFAFLLGIVVILSLFLCAEYILLEQKNRKNVKVTDKRTKTEIALFSFGLSAVVDLFYLFFCCFPGYITQDTVVQIMMMITGEYDNHHPYWNTKLIEWVLMPVYKATGNGNLGISLYCVLQILLISLCVMYLAVTLYEAGICRRILMILITLYCIMPYNIAFSAALAKDTPFAFSMLLLSVAMYRRINDFTHEKRDLILLALGTIGGCVFRTNGKIAVIAMIIVGGTVIRKYIDKKIIWTLIAGFVFAFLINNVYIAFLNIPQPDVVESLSIPLQQIARCSFDERELSESQAEFIANFGDYEQWGEIYNPSCSDNIKMNIRDNEKVDFVEDHKMAFIVNWAIIGLHNPYCYIKAWVDETRGFFAGSFYYSTWDNEFAEKIDMTPYGIYNTGHKEIPCKIWKLWNGLFVHNKIPPFEVVMAVGIRCFMILFGAVWAWKNNRKNVIMCVLPIAIQWTLLIATPLNYEFRYAYMIFTTFIIVMLGMLYIPGNTIKDSGDGENE